MNLFIELFFRFNHQQYCICILERYLHVAHHRMMQVVLGFEDTRRITVHDLEVIAIEDAHDAMTSSLRLGGDDGEVLTDELVHEGRLTHVGAAYDGDETGVVGHYLCKANSELRYSTDLRMPRDKRL